MYTPDLWYVRRLDLHELLPEAAMRAVTGHARLQRWEHAAVLDIQRDLDEVLIVLEGQVKLMPDATHSSHLVGMSRGDLFGALRPEEDAPGPEGMVSAYDPVTLATLSREDFERLVLPHVPSASFRSKMLPLANRRTVELPMHTLLYTSPAVRLARSLIHMAEIEAGPMVERDIVLDLPSRAKDLARLIGLEPASLEQPMHYFTRRGVLAPADRRRGARVAHRGVLSASRRQGLLIKELEPLRKAARGLSLI